MTNFFLGITNGQLLLPGSYAIPIQLALLTLLLIVATTVDVRERRIPNQLVASGIAVALVFHLIAPQGEGSAFALSGLCLGIASLLPMYLLRVMGAGDVKLMGMVGTFIGMHGVFDAVLASMAAGGILALCMAIIKGTLPQLVVNLRDILIRFQIQRMTKSTDTSFSCVPSVGNMPYALAISAGTLAQLSFSHV